MLDRTVIKGLIQHPDPDVLTALYLGYHDYTSLAEAERAVQDGEMSELELEALEEGLIDRDKL